MDGHHTNDPNDDPVPTTTQPRGQLFSPNQVSIIPLTRFVKSEKPAELDFIRVYVELQDDFHSQIKSPGTFRFELYNRALRSVDPMGKRIEIWKDITLTNLNENNRYWREFCVLTNLGSIYSVFSRDILSCKRHSRRPRENASLPIRPYIWDPRQSRDK